MPIIKITEAAGDVRVDPGTVTNLGPDSVEYGDIGAPEGVLAPGDGAEFEARPTWVRLLGGRKARLSHRPTD